MIDANRVNDEFDVGYNEKFEASWHRAELAGRVVMVIFVICATLGFLGRGPFSHETAKSADGKLRVDYEPVARHSTATTVTLHIPNTAGSAEPVEIQLDQHIIEPMGFQHALPRADATEFDDAGARLRFIERPDQKDGLIRLALTPSVVGPIQMGVRVGHEHVSWHIFVMP
jgi:hypothetical protein